jgi:hypothetical protein
MDPIAWYVIAGFFANDDFGRFDDDRDFIAGLQVEALERPARDRGDDRRRIDLDDHLGH